MLDPVAAISSMLVQSPALMAFPLTVYMVGQSRLSANGSHESAATTENIALNVPHCLHNDPRSCTHSKALRITGLARHAACNYVQAVGPTVHIQ